MVYVFSITAVIIVVMIVISAVVLIRTNIISKIRFTAMDIIHQRNMELITQNLGGDTEWAERRKNWAIVESPTYAEMVFDFTKWTFNQCYPQLKEVK